MIKLIGSWYRIIPLLVAIALVGCTGSKSEDQDEYLIRVGDNVVTVLDFSKAFEIAKKVSRKQ